MNAKTRNRVLYGASAPNLIGGAVVLFGTRYTVADGSGGRSARTSY